MFQTGEMVQELRGHTAAVQSSAFSSDSQRVVRLTLCLYFNICFDVFRMRCTECFSVGSLQATGSWDRSVRVWELHDDKEVVTLQGHLGNVACLCFSVTGILVSTLKQIVF